MYFIFCCDALSALSDALSGRMAEGFGKCELRLKLERSPLELLSSPLALFRGFNYKRKREPRTLGYTGTRFLPALPDSNRHALLTSRLSLDLQRSSANVAILTLKMIEIIQK